MNFMLPFFDINAKILVLVKGRNEIKTKMIKATIMIMKVLMIVIPSNVTYDDIVIEDDCMMIDYYCIV